jgi:DNA-binding CsgD family transcriptional regulator
MMPSQSTTSQRSANLHTGADFEKSSLKFDNSAYADADPATSQALPAHAPEAALAQSLAAIAVNELASGLIIIDQYARMLHRNPAADAVLARADCIAVDSGHITVTHMPDIRKFSQALTLAAAGQRSMVALGAYGHMTVAVIPLQPAGPQGKAIEHFALLFSRASMCEALMLGAFARAHQLTPTEERVLGLISTGLTVPEMAKRLTLGPATIRTHVRNICAKTCCHGLREIVTRLAVMPALKVNIA